MARGRHLLSARTVLSLKEPGRYADGDGLYLYIRQRRDLEKLWVFRFKRGGREASKEVTLSLGPARDVSLSLARDKAAICRRALEEGKDPKIELAGARAPTFAVVAADLLETIKPGFRNPKHAAQWETTLGPTYCGPLLSRPIDKITTDHVLEVLKPIWLSKPETASRIRGRIERVLDSAKARKLRDGENPARWRGHLSMLLPAQPRLSRGHHRALPWSEAPALLERIRKFDSVSALALEWTILNAVRTNETVYCRSLEIDTAAKVWIIPAERMKAKREHRVPLSARALEIYAEARKLGSHWLFPGSNLKAPLSLSAMAECLKGLEVNATVHGFRSTFRDWAGDATSFPEALAEAALAHAIKDKTEAAYRRSDALERRRELMEAWARYLEASSAVVPFARVK